MSYNPYESSYKPSDSISGREFLDTEPRIEIELVGDSMRSLARWQTFIAAVGLSACILMLLVLVVQLMAMRSFILTTWPVIFVALIYGILTFKLFQASTMARSFSSNNCSLLEAVNAQKIFWRVLGIIVICMLAIYGFALFFLTVGLI